VREDAIHGVEGEAIHADEKIPGAMDAHDDGPAVDLAGHPGVCGVLGGFDEIEGVSCVKFVEGVEGGEVPFDPVPDGRVKPVERTGESAPVEPAEGAAIAFDFVLGGDAVEVDVGLRDGGEGGGAGEDVDFVADAAEGACEAEHVGSDAAEALLGGVFVGEESDAHSFGGF
jgi:hypothetical protein